MSEVNYQALREAAQNYQSMLAWYQTIPDSPNAERDCYAALAAFKRHIRHREADIIADLLDELEEAKSQLNEQREYYEGVIADGGKRIAELEEIKSAAEKLVRCKGRFAVSKTIVRRLHCLA